MNKITCISVLFLSIATIKAQNLVWAKSFGGVGYDGANSVAIDTQGNVYSVGYFSGTVDFDPGVDTHNLTSNGVNDIYIQKLDALGNFKWAKSFGGTSYDRALSVAVDVQGSVYTVGYFEETIDFNPGMGTYNLTSNGGADVFIQKLNTLGDFVWAKSFGGAGFDWAHSVVVDIQGNVYTVGYFQGMIDFDPGSSVSYRLSNGFDDAYVQKLDASGNLIWVKSFGGTSYDRAHSVAVDIQGNVYSVGYFSETVDFDPDVGIYNLTSNGNLDIFVQKLNASGHFMWVKSFGGIDSDKAHSVVLDTYGNVYIVGEFNQIVDFDPGVDTHNLISNGFSDGFIQKLDTSGNFEWATTIGGISYDKANSVAVDIQGNVYTVGSFYETIDFDSSVGADSLTSNGGADVFIQKLDASSNLVWVKSFGGANYDEANSIVVDSNDNVHTIGRFKGVVGFDFGSDTDSLTSNGNSDIFVHKLNQCSPISIVQNGLTLETITGMDSYQWYLDSTIISGATNAIYTATENGAYHCVVVKRGCSESSDTININQVRINDITFDGLKIYPNPTKNILNIEVEGKLEIIQLIGLRGKVVKTFDAKNRKLDISTIPKGVYFIKLSNATKQSIQKVIVF